MLDLNDPELQGKLKALIRQRGSEYVEFADIPLQLVKNKRQVEASISDLEQKLGLRTPD